VSAANPAYRKSLIPAPASVQVSRRPNRGASTDEGVAEEARHVVSRNRPGGLEARSREGDEVEPGLVAQVAIEPAGERARDREAAHEGAHDRGVGAVGGPLDLDRHAGVLPFAEQRQT
jgi:hypothetical protein